MRPPTIRLRGVVLAWLSAWFLLAGCTVVGPSATTPPTPSANQASSATPAPSPAGPTALADWTARQGFGGSSGLGIIRDNLLFVVGHPSEMTSYDVDADKADVTNLAGWLDVHPATACWAAYHAVVRDGLAKLATGYEQIRTYVDVGDPVPNDVAAGLKGLADDLVAMPPPSGCP